jgi:hypothetical protein
MPATADISVAAVPKPILDKPGKRSEMGPSQGESQGAELGEQIGSKLKSMFEDVVAEPVPEKFRQLLEELERKSGKPKSGKP